MTALLEYATVVAFITFLGIVFWAYSRKRAGAFDEAAHLPFDLPDEAVSYAHAAAGHKVGASNE